MGYRQGADDASDRLENHQKPQESMVGCQIAPDDGLPGAEDEIASVSPTCVGSSTEVVRSARFSLLCIGLMVFGSTFPPVRAA